MYYYIHYVDRIEHVFLHDQVTVLVGTLKILIFAGILLHLFPSSLSLIICLMLVNKFPLVFFVVIVILLHFWRFEKKDMQ